MAYIKPLVEVHQEFETVPAGITDPLRALIVGPNFQLVQDNEEGLLGEYDSASDVCYLWPGREAGSVVDEDYTRLFMDDALLQYFNSAAVSGADCKATFCDLLIGGSKNRVRSSVISWAANGASFLRHALLYERDVQVGDSVKITGVVGGSVETYWSYVAGLIYDAVASSIDNDYEDADNQADDTASTASAKVAGVDNGIFIDSVDGSAYDGLADGDVVETYTVTVTQGGDPADPGNLPILQVTSASGNDDVASVVPSVFDVATAIGTRGLTATFDTGGSSSSSSTEGSAISFIAGQSWEIGVAMDFTAPTAAASGDYTGPTDTSYIIEVTQGGLWNDGPQIMVTTTTGIDASGPHTLSALNPGDESLGSAAAAIGAYGIEITFDESGLCKGDRYYVDVSAESDGAARTLVLGKNLTDGLLGLDENGDCDTVPDLTVVLYIKKDIEVPQDRTGFAPLTNFDTEDTQICVNSGVISYDSTWVDALGDMLAMPVKGGTLWVWYRAYLSAYTTAAGSVTNPADVSDLLGEINTDNPLAYGVFKAASMANGTPVFFMATAGAELEDWAEVLQAMETRDDVYGLVPLTFERTVHDLFAGHCNAMSGPEVGRWRKAFVCSAVGSEQVIIPTQEDGDPLLATVTDDPAASGTQYTLVELDAESALEANFTDDGVRAGDILRAEYQSDGFGTMTYSEYVIDAILSDDSLRLLTGPDAAVNVASKIEIWRTLNASDKVTAVKADSGSFGSRRVHNIFPDYINSADVAVAGYYAAASIAGLISGIVPHQGLTRLEIEGYSGVPQITEVFSEEQLDDMAESGTWLITQDPGSGAIFTRHALTTNTTDLNRMEEVINRNVDSISYQCLRALEPFIGRTNVTDENIDQINTELESILGFLSSSSSTRSLGPQLIEFDIVSLEQHPVLLDRIVAVINLTLPSPLNNLEIHLVV